MSTLDRLYRLATHHAAPVPSCPPTPSERRALRRRAVWASLVWVLAFAGFGGFVFLRIVSYLPPA